ncbi:MAG: hypothetical protein ACO3NW_08485, partial [Kiritimatiellia bacterium]
RWFGLCRDGLGFSSGFGLVVDEQGNVVEYIGNTAGGLADGDGAMILRPAGFDTLATLSFGLASESRIHECALPSLLIIFLAAAGLFSLNRMISTPPRP